VAGYVVYRDGVAVGETELTSYVDSSVLPGRTHRYAVAAKDFAGNLSPVSPEFVLVVPEPGKPWLDVSKEWLWAGGLVALLMLTGVVGWRRAVVRRRRLPPVSPLAHGKHRARAKERSY
jgi:hypothetical protein